jgi:hypothetical protein
MNEGLLSDTTFLVESRQDPGYSPVTAVTATLEYPNNMSYPPHSNTGFNIWSTSSTTGNNAIRSNKSVQYPNTSNEDDGGQDSSFYSTHTATSLATNATINTTSPWDNYNNNNTSNNSYDDNSAQTAAIASSQHQQQYPIRNSSLALAASASATSFPINPQGLSYGRATSSPGATSSAQFKTNTQNMMYSISESMHQLHVSSSTTTDMSAGQRVGGRDASAAFSVGSYTSQSVPGVVGASSGSTLGGISGVSTSRDGVGQTQQHLSVMPRSTDDRWSLHPPSQQSYPWTAREDEEDREGGGRGQQKQLPFYHQATISHNTMLQKQQYQYQQQHQQNFSSGLSAAAATAATTSADTDVQLPVPPTARTGFRSGYEGDSSTTHTSRTHLPQWTDHSNSGSTYSYETSSYGERERETNPHSTHPTLTATSTAYTVGSYPSVHATERSGHSRAGRGARGKAMGNENLGAFDDRFRSRNNSQYDGRRHTHQPYQRLRGNLSSLQKTAVAALPSIGDHRYDQGYRPDEEGDDRSYNNSSPASSEAIRMLMRPPEGSLSSSSTLIATRLPLERLTGGTKSTTQGTGVKASSSLPSAGGHPILPAMEDMVYDPSNGSDEDQDEEEDDYSHLWGADSSTAGGGSTVGTTQNRKREWLLRMNRRLVDIPVGDLDPSVTPINAIMNAWAKTKSAHGANMVEQWLNRAQQEYDHGNVRVIVTSKMYTMAVDAWAKSGEGVSAAQRAESILQHMNQQYQATGLEELKPTTGIFNAGTSNVRVP